jgi:hypothetical protein
LMKMDDTRNVCELYSLTFNEFGWMMWFWKTVWVCVYSVPSVFIMWQLWNNIGAFSPTYRHKAQWIVIVI